jgi:hypothetical protein
MRQRDQERDAQRLREIRRWGPILMWIDAGGTRTRIPAGLTETKQRGRAGGDTTVQGPSGEATVADSPGTVFQRVLRRTRADFLVVVLSRRRQSPQPEPVTR